MFFETLTCRRTLDCHLLKARAVYTPVADMVWQVGDCPEVGCVERIADDVGLVVGIIWQHDGKVWQRIVRQRLRGWLELLARHIEVTCGRGRRGATQIVTLL